MYSAKCRLTKKTCSRHSCATKNFLSFNPSVYNSPRLGTTQLYNKTVVYNHKRHGQFKLGNRTYDFRVKHRFPNRRR